MNAVYIVLRFISLFLIVAALMLLGADVITTLEKGPITTRSIAQVWSAISPDSLAGFKSWLEQTLPSPVPGWIEGILDIWGWLVTGVIGVILAFLFGRRVADVS